MAHHHAEVILLNPSYVFPPFSPEARNELRNDPLFMDLPGEEFLYPPVGLLSIGGALRRAGFSTTLLDCNTFPQSVEDTARWCEGAKVVGISLLVANLRSTYLLVQAMKGRGYHVVLGGAYPSVTPEIVAQMGLQYGISGEGEESFPALCRALIHGDGRPEDIPGIIVAEHPGDLSRTEVFTQPPVLLTDLDNHMPDRSLLRDGAYKLPFAGRIELALASRGCPYKCTFCYCSSASPNSMFNTSRWVSVDRVVADVVDTVRATNPPHLEMIDETFTVDRKYVVAFCEALIASGVRVRWGAKTRIDLVDEELIALMARAGLVKLGFGLESGVYDHRRRMRKNFSNEKVAEVFAACRRHGVDPACTIIFGHPDETRAEMQESVRFVKEIRARYVEFHIMVLIPKTELFSRALRENKVTEDVFVQFMRGEVGYPEYAPGDMTPSEMRQIHRRAVRAFYFRPSYIADMASRVRSAQDVLQYGRAAKSLLKMTDLRRPVWMVGRRKA